MRRQDFCIDEDIILRRLKVGRGGLPSLKLVSSYRGLDFALPSGKVMDWSYFRSNLREVGIYPFAVAGVVHHIDAKTAASLELGQRLFPKREPDNPYHRHAVGLTIGRERTQIGYVQAGNAYGVASQLDGGQDMVGTFLQLQNPMYPLAFLTRAAILEHLLRS